MILIEVTQSNTALKKIDLPPGVDFTKLFLPSENSPAYSFRLKNRRSISPTVKASQFVCYLPNISIKMCAPFAIFVRRKKLLISKSGENFDEIGPWRALPFLILMGNVVTIPPTFKFDLDFFDIDASKLRTEAICI